MLGLQVWGRGPLQLSCCLGLEQLHQEPRQVLSATLPWSQLKFVELKLFLVEHFRPSEQVFSDETVSLEKSPTSSSQGNLPISLY